MAKLKLGIIGDAGCPTGFATVTHNVVDQLLATGDYEIEIIGINFDGRPNEWSQKYKIWPAALGGDLLGVGLIPRFINEFKPDCFMMFQDFWNIPLYLGQIPQGQPGLFAYYPVDAPNIKGQYMLAIAGTNATACYTKFGIEESVRGAKESWEVLREKAEKDNAHILENIDIGIAGGLGPHGQAMQNKILRIYVQRLSALRRPESYSQIPHGIDVKSFYPLDSKKGARKLTGLPLNGFIVGNVNRNQSRKRIDLTIRGFSEFAKTHSDALLLLHCVKTDMQGWDLQQLVQYYGIQDKVIFTHTLFKDMQATIDQLNLVYNSLDVQINTGGGEGWGLTTFEGAAARVPQIVPDWSATKEIWEGSAKLLKVASVRHEPAQINTMQAVIDTSHLVELLSELHDDTAMREDVAEKCFQVTQRDEYKWENVGKKFDSVFKSIAGKQIPHAPTPVTNKGLIEFQKMRR